MLSLGSVAASENVTSDEISNNDFVSLSVYSTLEVENDDVNTQETENEVSLETNNKKTRSSRDVLKVSNNSPLKADPKGNTFADINQAINDTSSGETVFLNGKNYNGNQQITIDRDITIDGASKSNSNLVSILDANGTYRIFNSGKHNVVLKNLIFENPDLSVTGYCAYFAKGGNLTIQNVTIRNIKGTLNTTIAILLAGGSTVNANNLTFNNNSIITNNSNYNGLLFRAGPSSNVTMSNLNIYDNNISALNNLRGFVYVGGSSNVNMSNLNIYNNNVSAQNNIIGFVRVNSLSEINIANVNFYNNYFEAKQNIEGIFLHYFNSTAICSAGKRNC